MKKSIFLALTTLCFGMSLQEAIETALSHSPTLQAQKLAVKMQKEQKEAVKAKSYGQVDINGAYNHYNVPRTLKPLTPPITPGITTSKDITSLGGRYSVALFKGFADLAQIEVAKLSAQKMEIGYKLTKEELIYNIKALYFKALGLKESEKATDAHIKALKSLYEAVKKEVALGKRPPLEKLKIKSSLLGVESKKISIQNAIQAIKAHLSALIGAPFDAFAKAKESLKRQNSTPYLIKEYYLDVRKSKKELKKAKSLYYPKLFLDANYAKNFAKGEDEEVWQASLALNYTLFDFGYKSHTYQKAKIASMIAKKRFNAKKERLYADIKEAFLQRDTLIKNLNSLRVNLKLLKKIEEIEKIKYTTGRSEVDDYLSAIANTKEAQSRIASTTYELYTKEAYINYLKAGE